jgi:lysophospholipase L1-like esterase
MKRLTGCRRWIGFSGWSLCALVASCAAAHSQQFTLKDDDTVVFYGDSITAQRLYTRYAEEFVLTRYPQLHVRFVNAGVPGDSVSGGYAGTIAERVKRDVAPFHPAMITVMLGMNDGGWGGESPQIDAAFRKGYTELLDTLHTAAPDAAMTLIRPTPYDEITHGTEFPGYSGVIDDLANDVSHIAAERRAHDEDKTLHVDFHQPLIDALKRAAAISPELAALIAPDRIHPSEIGHWIMAAELLSAWHIDPVVSLIRMDAGKAEILDKHRTMVTELRKTTTGITWTQTDEALPLPFDFNNALILLLPRISEIAQVDQQILRVEALDAGQYQLLIDGKAIGTFSRDALQAGVNLALYKTPMVDQARDMDDTQNQRMQLDRARFVLSANLNEDAASISAEDKLRQAEDQLSAEMRKKLNPAPHKFELRRQ